MLAVTQSAVEYLKIAIVGVERPENACFRLRTGLKGVDLMLDETRPGDQIVDHEGHAILALEPSVAAEVNGKILDYDEEQSRLVLIENS